MTQTDFYDCFAKNNQIKRKTVGRQEWEQGDQLEDDCSNPGKL